MMPALQIWSCHVTQEANFEKILLFSNSTFNIRKSYKISNGKALYFRSYQLKTSQGVENTPPSAFRVNSNTQRGKPAQPQQACLPQATLGMPQNQMTQGPYIPVQTEMGDRPRLEQDRFQSQEELLTVLLILKMLGSFSRPMQ